MSSRILSLVCAAASGLLLQACASVSGMETTSMNEASTRVIEAPKDAVLKATEASIHSLGYELQSVKAGEPTTHVYFIKPLSAFSWGEVGRIDVESNPRVVATRVSIATSKRLKTQLTGTSQSEFSAALFAAINDHLKK